MNINKYKFSSFFVILPILIKKSFAPTNYFNF
nr:CPPV048 hypothetical protein [Cooks petrelpox virus]